MVSTPELVRQAQAGSDAAFSVLFSRYKRRIEAVGRRVVFDPTAAEDVAQEAFEQAWRSLSTLREPAAIESWLYSITLRVGRRQLSRDLSTIAHPAQTVGEVGDAREDPQQSAERLELNEWVLRAVEALPDSLRAPTILYYYDFLTVAEIAALLDISVAAAKVRLHRSRQTLQRTISNRYNAEYFREYRQRRVNAMVQAEVIDVAHTSDGIAILLFDRAGTRVLPVFVGPAEGVALAQALAARSFPRPLTYELIHDMLGAVGAEVRHVRIESLQKPSGVFIGLVTLEIDGQEREIDARPSDAINLALRSGAGIYVAPAVMEVAAAVERVTPESRFRPKGAEALASRSLELAPREAPEPQNGEPGRAGDSVESRPAAAPPPPRSIPDDAFVAERLRLLGDYVRALVEGE